MAHTFPQGPASPLHTTQESADLLLQLACSWLPGFPAYGSLLFLSTSLGNVPLCLEALVGRRSRRNESGVCRKAKVKSLISDGV